MLVSLLAAHLTSEVAIILLFKHAAVLCLSEIPAKSALTQAESNFQKAKIASQIKNHFTASYQEYSIEHITNFLINTNIGLFGYAFLQIMADITFQAV